MLNTHRLHLAHVQCQNMGLAKNTDQFFGFLIASMQVASSTNLSMNFNSPPAIKIIESSLDTNVDTTDEVEVMICGLFQCSLGEGGLKVGVNVSRDWLINSYRQEAIWNHSNHI